MTVLYNMSNMTEKSQSWRKNIFFIPWKFSTHYYTRAYSSSHHPLLQQKQAKDFHKKLCSSHNIDCTVEKQGWDPTIPLQKEITESSQHSQRDTFIFLGKKLDGGDRMREVTYINYPLFPTRPVLESQAWVQNHVKSSPPQFRGKETECQAPAHSMI